MAVHWHGNTEIQNWHTLGLHTLPTLSWFWQSIQLFPKKYSEKNIIYLPGNIDFEVIVFVESISFHVFTGRFRCIIGSALDHRSPPPEFESRLGHIWRLFHLILQFITFGSHLAHLAYLVHKIGCKTSIIIIIIIHVFTYYSIIVLDTKVLLGFLTKSLFLSSQHHPECRMIPISEWFLYHLDIQIQSRMDLYRFQDMDCPEGFRCILQEVKCIKAPCPPVPQCVGESFVRREWVRNLSLMVIAAQNAN